MSSDIHGARGFSCVDCHHGDANEDDPFAAMNPQKGFIGKPAQKDIPALCGNCHSNAEQMKKFAPALRVDQEREYLTSVHGQRLKNGDQKVATCISCHGNHGIRAVNDPLSPVYSLNVADTCSRCHSNADYIKGYEIASDQYDKYRASAHAKALYERQDLSAPTCNDCHGNHGAAPPGFASVANVCGQCHVRQSSLFASSPHKSAFDAMEIGECIQCHNNHDVLQPGDEMIGVGEESVCISCHVSGDGGYIAAEKMRGRIDELAASIGKTNAILDQAERAGMEVSRPKFELNEARDALTHARVLIHKFSTDDVDEVIRPGLETAANGYRAGEAALSEWGYRRKGLAASLFFILFLAALIYLKVRQIESAQRNASR
ncbi:MAG TPA: multiheme c-type cytochrome [Blastocatellia bacterium]|nr:multiheme c-type cytochrome [Blastocatellia bacterium]